MRVNVIADSSIINDQSLKLCDPSRTRSFETRSSLRLEYVIVSFVLLVSHLSLSQRSLSLPITLDQYGSVIAVYIFRIFYVQYLVPRVR